MDKIKPQEVEKNLDKKQESTSDSIIKWEKTSNELKKIKIMERVWTTKDDLSKIWKLDANKPSANFMFLDKNWNKDFMKIDIITQTLEFNWKTIKIELPKWASINEVSFNEEVKITGKVWIFSWSWSTSYEKLINAIDEALDKWSYKLIAWNQEIWFKIIA